ncbi:MAG TPA: ATP-binding protein [Dehalococcoidia bacterium]
MHKKFELKIDSRLENLPVIADFISGSMSRLGLESGKLEVELAVDEACTNIMKYAYAGNEGRIIITCEIQDNELVITIQDNGNPFNPSSVPKPDLAADLDHRKVGGLGIFLMRRLMDDVSYSFDREKGNLLTMRKKLTTKEP